VSLLALDSETMGRLLSFESSFLSKSYGSWGLQRYLTSDPVFVGFVPLFGFIPTRSIVIQMAPNFPKSSMCGARKKGAYEHPPSPQAPRRGLGTDVVRVME
jgi:hypothetical protein